MDTTDQCLQLERSLRAWDSGAVIEARLGGGNCNGVWAVRLGRRRYAARVSRRSNEALAWELDLLAYLAAAGLCVARPLPTASGARSVDGVALFTWLDGEPPLTARDWERVAAALRRLHGLTRTWPQRPGFRSTQDLLTRIAGGDVRLDAMPDGAVTSCRQFWAALAGEPCSVVHGDPGANNIRLRHDIVGLLDWDEARVDVSLLDFADLPVPVVELGVPERTLKAKRAADAWEAAACWQLEPEYARRRLARLQTQ